MKNNDSKFNQKPVPLIDQDNGGDSWQEHEARDDCATWFVEERIQIQTQSQATAWASRLSAKEVQDLHLCEWLFLAWSPDGYASA